MAYQIQIRNDLAANWTSVNPTLAQGEMGYEDDTGRIKIGDGTTSWVSLPYPSFNSDTFSDSLVQSGFNVTLVNDASSPGTTKYYGTDSGGVKGFFSIPASGITDLTGDVTATGPGSVAATLATVNSNVGSYSPAAVTVNAKGLVTAASSVTTGNLSDAGTDGITVTGGTGSVIGSGTSISQHVADVSNNGYLSSTDWSTFNGKQPAGNYITALTGDISASGPGSAAATLSTVNSNTGSWGTAYSVSTITLDGKGRVTAASNTSIQITESQVTNLTTDLADKLAVQDYRNNFLLMGG